MSTAPGGRSSRRAHAVARIRNDDPYSQFNPRPPIFVPDEPWADYYRTLFPGHVRPRNGFHAWKYGTTAMDIAQSLWRSRELGRQAWEHATIDDESRR